MTTLDRPRTDPGIEKKTQMNKWLVGAVVLFVLLAATFFILWMVETNETADLEASATAMETDLAETEAALTASRADLAETDANLAAARAELAARAEAVHPLQGEVDALFERTAAVIADPSAAEIASLFTPNGTHTSYDGITTTGAQEIGELYGDGLGFTFTLNGPAVLNGDDPRFTAVIPGSAFGRTGFAVAIVQKWEDDYLFHDFIWYAP